MSIQGFLQNSAVHHLKTLPDRKKLTTYLKSAQNMPLVLPTLVRATTNKNYFVIQGY